MSGTNGPEDQATRAERPSSATDPMLRRDVALKFLLEADVGRARRFIAEARAQARVEHEHVGKVYEVGTAQGLPYIARNRSPPPRRRARSPKASAR